MADAREREDFCLCPSTVMNFSLNFSFAGAELCFQELPGIYASELIVILRLFLVDKRIYKKNFCLGTSVGIESHP